GGAPDCGGARFSPEPMEPLGDVLQRPPLQASVIPQPLVWDPVAAVSHAPPRRRRAEPRSSPQGTVGCCGAVTAETWESASRREVIKADPGLTLIGPESGHFSRQCCSSVAPMSHPSPPRSRGGTRRRRG